MNRFKDVKIIDKKDFKSFVNNLIKEEEHEVIGVKAKGEKFVFAPLENAGKLRLDYDITILPPKKYFLPQYETMMGFNLDKPLDVKETDLEKPRIIIGVHPYDIIALQQTDKLYFDPER